MTNQCNHAPCPRLRAVGVLVLAATTACVGTPERFAKKAAKITCQHYEECEKEFFDAEYDGADKKCRDEVESANNDSSTMLQDAGCEYQKDKARDCLATARKNKKECGDSANMDSADACSEVWKCPDMIQSAPLSPADLTLDELAADLDDAAPGAYDPLFYAVHHLE